MTAIEFEAFGKIPRLFRDMVITEKIDGTNAAVGVIELSGALEAATREFEGKVVVVPDNHLGAMERVYLVYAQSRTRLISPGKSTDNHGFAGWVWDNAAELVRILGPGLHFGEWWGLGVNRGYGLDHKRLSLFNTKRWGWLEIPEARRDHNPPEQLHVVPTLRQWTFDTDKIIGSMADLERDGSRAAPGYMKPEGIVVYHTAGSVMFKATLDGDAAKSEMALAA